MAREIKFRGIHPSSKVIMDVCVIDWMHDEVYFEQGSDVAYGIDECQLIQYTGLKDKNGVEIFDGDILRSKSHGSTTIVAVSLGDGGAVINGGTIKEIRVSSMYISTYEFEVIGNIHQNPELLK